MIPSLINPRPRLPRVRFYGYFSTGFRERLEQEQSGERGRGGWFYFGMSLLIAAVVIYGFSHTVNQNLIHAAPPRPWLLWVHATLFSCWVRSSSCSRGWCERTMCRSIAGWGGLRLAWR